MIHPDMVDSLGNFFPDTCTVQEFSTTYNDYNEPVKSWTDKFINVACAIGEDTQQEIKMEDKTIKNSTHRIVLKGQYDISEKDRVKVGDDYFDILLATEGTKGIKTSLICEKLNV